ARKLHVFGVDVGVEGGRGRWKAVKGGQGQQQPRQCDSPAAYLHRPPLLCTALHRISFHLSLPFAYTPTSADSLGGILSRLRSASSAARSTSAVTSASMSASRVAATPRCFRYSSYKPIGSRRPGYRSSRPTRETGPGGDGARAESPGPPGCSGG